MKWPAPNGVKTKVLTARHRRWRGGAGSSPLDGAAPPLDAASDTLVDFHTGAHKHSVSVLLARVDQLKGPDGWNTWIDYDRFHVLASSGEPFTVEDYASKCPPWALLGAAEDGFDPSDTRMYKKKANGKSR